MNTKLNRLLHIMILTWMYLPCNCLVQNGSNDLLSTHTLHLWEWMRIQLCSCYMLLLHFCKLSNAVFGFLPWSFLLFPSSIFISCTYKISISAHILLAKQWLSCARVRCILSQQMCASPACYSFIVMVTTIDMN